MYIACVPGAIYEPGCIVTYKVLGGYKVINGTSYQFTDLYTNFDNRIMIFKQLLRITYVRIVRVLTNRQTNYCVYSNRTQTKRIIIL